MDQSGVTQEQVAELCGVAANTVQQWKSGDMVPNAAVAVKTAILAGIQGPAIPPEPTAPEPQKPEHLRREFQRTHTFTMIVQAMWDLEKRSDEGDDEAWRRLRIIWNLLHSIRPLVEEIGGWTDDDWKRLRGVDHWRRITKRGEVDVERLLEEARR